jgi:hypothetical protein
MQLHQDPARGHADGVIPENTSRALNGLTSSAKRDRKNIVSVSACDIAARMFAMCCLRFWKSAEHTATARTKLGAEITSKSCWQTSFSKLSQYSADSGKQERNETKESVTSKFVWNRSRTKSFRN